MYAGVNFPRENASLAVDRPRADVYKIARKYVKNYVRRG
nr:MAG TPA: hypothetical protein [Caudoviricetes sp.]